jgi:hypothetical protein
MLHVTRATRPRFARLFVPALLLLACKSSPEWKPPSAQDRHDIPAEVRPGHGDSGLGTWFPLTPPERAALVDLPKARAGDARALLALAIVASAGPRDAATYAAIQQRVDRFVADVRPVIAAAGDDWHRGYELHRAMHRTFFNSGRELGGYQANQSRLTTVFSEGRYNCLSSAALFVVLARAFGMPVRAAAVPTHVFVEMGAPGGKIIEIETTSPTGFDLVHDARFYKEEEARWSSSRGLRPVTFEEYQRRNIIEPHRLMAHAMMNAHPGESAQDRARMTELAALVDGDDVELQQNRVAIYINEANDLLEAKAFRTMAKLFDTVTPAIRDIAGRFRDGKTLQLVSWAGWYHSHALLIVGRQAEATAVISDGLDRLDPSWPEADTLKTNYVSELNNRLIELIEKKDAQGALELFGRHKAACLSNEICAGNVGIVYGNWSIDYENAGDWPSARRVLQECVTELPNEARCKTALADLESRHNF